MLSFCCKRRHCVMPFAPRIVAQATFGGERVRYAVRREAAHERSRSTAPVGLRRMRELRNCHFRGNLCPTRGESLACKRISTKWRTSAAREVPQAAHYLGVAETVSRRVLNCCENSGGEENQK